MARVMFRMPPMRSAATVMAVTLIAASVVGALLRPVQLLLSLVTADVTGRFFLWQPLTYVFVEVSPLGVIFGGFIIWSVGGELERIWGRARFIRFALGLPVVAAVLTVAVFRLLALVLEPTSAALLVGMPLPGGGVLTGAIWVGYGLHLGRTQTNFWGFPLTGNALAGLGVAFLALNLAFNFASWPVFLPEIFALFMAWFVVRVGGPGDLMTRFRSWQLERDLKKRSAHLKSLDGGRSSGRGSDKYLH